MTARTEDTLTERAKRDLAALRDGTMRFSQIPTSSMKQLEAAGIVDTTAAGRYRLVPKGEEQQVVSTPPAPTPSAPDLPPSVRKLLDQLVEDGDVIFDGQRWSLPFCADDGLRNPTAWPGPRTHYVFFHNWIEGESDDDDYWISWAMTEGRAREWIGPRVPSVGDSQEHQAMVRPIDSLYRRAVFDGEFDEAFARVNEIITEIEREELRRTYE